MNECKECGKKFENKYERYEHLDCIPEEDYKQHAMRRDELLEDVEITKSARQIYVLKIIRESDGKEFYYVGETTDFVQRIHSHIRDRCIRVINQDESGFTKDYKIKEIVDVEPLDVDNRSLATYYEREKALQLAIDNKSVNILGGR